MVFRALVAGDRTEIGAGLGQLGFAVRLLDGDGRPRQGG
jgi:hypothetical protein